MVNKIFRAMLGIIFVLLCFSMFRTLLFVLVSLNGGWGNGISAGAIAFFAGFIAWLAVFLFLPRPVTAYVFAHEITHALCAFFSGETVGRISISRKGGAVSVSGANFFTVLAPYFCPFYTVLVVIAYYVVWLFVDPAPFEAFWIALLGATWCFHVTFTVKALVSDQPDIKAYGSVFAYGFVFFMNILVVCAGLIAVSSVTLEMFVERAATDFSVLWRQVMFFYNNLCIKPFSVYTG